MKIHHKKAHGESIAGHEITCDECDEAFSKTPCLINRDDNHYCSKACRLNGQNRSDEELIGEIHRLRGDLGRNPTKEDIRDKSGCDIETFVRHFGSWNNALQQAGVGINEKWRHSESDCLADIQTVAEEVGESPRVSDHMMHGTVNPSIIINKFGSWAAAVDLAGLDATNIPEKKISEERLLDEIERVEEQLGRTPRLKDMDRLSRFSSATYQNRLGWTETLRELGFELNYGKESPNKRRYSSGWPDQKIKARSRDGHQCVRCGMGGKEHIERYGRRLNVHHVTWDESKTAEERDRLSNLLTLCVVCHPQIESWPVIPQVVVT